MALKKWYEVIEEDFPDFEVTEQTIENTVRASQYGFRSSTRQATGRIWTSEAYEARRQRELNTPLP